MEQFLADLGYQPDDLKHQPNIPPPPPHQNSLYSHSYTADCSDNDEFDDLNTLPHLYQSPEPVVTESHSHNGRTEKPFQCHEISNYQQNQEPITQSQTRWSPTSVNQVASAAETLEDKAHVQNMLRIVRQSLLDSSQFEKNSFQTNIPNQMSSPYLNTFEQSFYEQPLVELFPTSHQDPIRERRARWMRDWEAQYGVVNDHNEDLGMISETNERNNSFFNQSLTEALRPPLPPPPPRIAPDYPEEVEEEDYPLPPLHQAPNPFIDSQIPCSPSRRLNRGSDAITAMPIDFRDMRLSQALPPRSPNHRQHPQASRHASQESSSLLSRRHLQTMTDRERALANGFHGDLSEIMPPVEQETRRTQHRSPVNRSESNRTQRRYETDRERALANGFHGDLSEIMPPVEQFESSPVVQTRNRNRRASHRSRAEVTTGDPLRDPLAERVVNHHSEGLRWEASPGDFLGDRELSYDRLLSLDDNVPKPKPKKGTGDVIGKAIKSIKFRPAKHGNDPCVICLEMFKSGEGLVTIRNCRCTKSLLYHDRCLRQWLQADSSCPQCRTSAI